MIATVPRKRGPGRPKKHGGKRPGAGRPRLEGGGTVKLSVTLTEKNVQRVERWQEQTGADTFSGALQQMIDAIPE